MKLFVKVSGRPSGVLDNFHLDPRLDHERIVFS